MRTAGGGASITVRNLRIREDTAKYLRNLDVDSAHYDPKTRSMREDPTPNADPEKHVYLGDNAYRKTGDTQEFERMNTYAWEAYAKGQEISLPAAPSAAESLHKVYLAKKEALVGQKKRDVLERYGNAAAGGGAEAPSELLLGQTEVYVEYDRAGRLIRGAERAVPRSKYEEDVLAHNHTAVWGSFWAAGQWGYACCRSFVRNAYCTGRAGIEAAAAAEVQMLANVVAKAAAKPEEEERKAEEYKRLMERKKAQWGTEVAPDLELDQSRLAEAMAKEEARLAKADEGERKRGYNVTYDDEASAAGCAPRVAGCGLRVARAAGGAFPAAQGLQRLRDCASAGRREAQSVLPSPHPPQVSAEDMEAYRLKRARGEDPLKELGGAGTDGYELV